MYVNAMNMGIPIRAMLTHQEGLKSYFECLEERSTSYEHRPGLFYYALNFFLGMSDEATDGCILPDQARLLAFTLISQLVSSFSCVALLLVFS